MKISTQVWIQTIGRGLYQLGSAVLLFYMPIVFVNYGNLSATEVGLAIGGGSVAGLIGNILGGILTDSKLFGRKYTLLGSSLFAISACIVAIFTVNFPVLLLANIIFGFSTGLYWIAADASVMDVTVLEQRQTAFSYLGVADNIGFGTGTLGGGLLIKLVGRAEMVFLAGAIAFGILLLLFILAMEETRVEASESPKAAQGWKIALTDGRLMIYLFVNTLFIMYIALAGGTLPLYFVNFGGTTDATVANLFTWAYVGFGALLQIPIIKAIAKLNYLNALMVSMGVWGIGYIIVAILGNFSNMSEITELGVFALFAIGSVIYKPTSSAWISKLAPASLRGAYTAIAFQCWTIGYIVGPIVGGWAMDQSRHIAQYTWVAVGLSTLFGILVLELLNRRNLSKQSSPEVAVNS